MERLAAELLSRSGYVPPIHRSAEECLPCLVRVVISPWCGERRDKTAGKICAAFDLRADDGALLRAREARESYAP